MTFSERILQFKKEYIYAEISILLWAIMAVLFACIILKEKMTLRKAVAILLSLIWTSLVLKEDLSIYSVLGLIVIVAGIFVQLGRKNYENNKN